MLRSDFWKSKVLEAAGAALEAEARLHTCERLVASSQLELGSMPRPQRASAIAGVAAAAAALQPAPRMSSAAAAAAAAAAAPAATAEAAAAAAAAGSGSRQSQRGRIEKKDSFGFVWGGATKLEPEPPPPAGSIKKVDKASAGKGLTLKLKGAPKGTTVVARSGKRAADGGDTGGAQKKRPRVLIRVRGATSPRHPPTGSSAAAAAAAPRVRLVLGQGPSLPRDALKGEGRTGSSLKISKLLDEQFASKYRSTFIANIRSFIAKFGDELVVPGLLSHLKLEEDVPDAECSIVRGWKVKLKTDDGSFWLRIYEDTSQSTCYQCHCLRWGAAPCGLATASKFHLAVVSAAATPPGGEPPVAAAAVLSLHGVLHGNGVGHIRSVNGKEGGGEHTGTLMMQVWDGLCLALGARMVSVQDVAARSGMYLRFTHAVANGRSWYGKWQYKFRRGSFGLQSKDYAEAVAGLQATTVEQLSADLRDASFSSELQALIQRHRNAGKSMTTLSQLFRQLMASCRGSGSGSKGGAKIETALADLYTLSAQICVAYRAAKHDEQGDLKRWVTTLLDCKWFAKDYTRRPAVTGLLRVRCTLRQQHQICCPEPRLEEDVFVKENARVRDFKIAAAGVLRTLYPPLSEFTPTQLWVAGSLGGESDDTPMRNLQPMHSSLYPTVVELEGHGIDMGRPDVDIVSCSCGATDDDGERMLACEDCSTWVHSRCIGLADDEDIAEKFSDGFRCSVCFMKEETQLGGDTCPDPGDAHAAAESTSGQPAAVKHEPTDGMQQMASSGFRPQSAGEMSDDSLGNLDDMAAGADFDAGW